MLKSVDCTYISTIRQVTKGIEDKLLSPDHSVQDQVHIRNNNNKILLLINGSDTKKKKKRNRKKKREKRKDQEWREIPLSAGPKSISIM